MAALELTSIDKSFDGTPILHAVDLALEDGEFLAIVGPSGCGKSTLLRIIAGLEPQDGGSVRIGGRAVDELPPKARDVAMVFQSYALYPHMTVAQNLALPLVMRDFSRVERLPFAGRLSRGVAERRRAIMAAVERAAAMVDLTQLLSRKPKQLSGGQRQRVALARALVRQPRLFLLDEPLSNLDAALRATTRTEIVDLQRRLGVTTVYVTHDQTEAMTMASRIAVMIEGRIIQLAEPREIYRQPADIRVARFIGSPQMNLLAGRAQAGRVMLGGAALPIEVRGLDDGPLHIGIRAEDVRLAAGAGGFTATVRNIEFLGSEALVHLEPVALACDRLLVARVEPDRAAALALGSAIRFGLAPDRLHVFAADGRRLDNELMRPALSAAAARMVAIP